MGEKTMARSNAKVIMVVAAHPDDAEAGCGGTIAKWIKAGATAYCLVATNGDKGDDEARVSAQELASIRKEEQEAASRALGVAAVAFLPHADGELVYSAELRGQVVRYIRKWKPDAVFTHDPTTFLRGDFGVNHVDHRTIGAAAVDAVYPFARGKLQYPEHMAEGLEPHTVWDLYLWGSNEPNHWEDVKESVADKEAALMCHRSQYRDVVEFQKWIHSELSVAGREKGLDYAEAFRRINLKGVSQV